MRHVEEPYTTEKAARILGISRAGVRKHAERHGIGKKHGRDWLFTASDLERIRVEHIGKRGRPVV